MYSSTTHVPSHRAHSRAALAAASAKLLTLRPEHAAVAAAAAAAIMTAAEESSCTPLVASTFGPAGDGGGGGCRFICKGGGATRACISRCDHETEMSTHTLQFGCECAHMGFQIVQFTISHRNEIKFSFRSEIVNCTIWNPHVGTFTTKL